jgi:hypothetical protein
LTPTVNRDVRFRRPDPGRSPSSGTTIRNGALFEQVVQPVEAAAAADAGVAALADLLRGAGTVADARVHLGLADRGAEADVHGSPSMVR